MGFHRVHKAILASEYSKLVGATTRPNAWPSFGFQSAEILMALDRISFWRVIFESNDPNRGENLIAKSVTTHDRTQSYVSVSFPSWLALIFVDESV